MGDNALKSAMRSSVMAENTSGTEQESQYALSSDTLRCNGFEPMGSEKAISWRLSSATPLMNRVSSLTQYW